jgi:hypothetical protein
MISFSRLAADRSWDETVREGREIERLGRCGDCVGLLVPWLEKDVLRERADDNSCDSETDWESDLPRNHFDMLICAVLDERNIPRMQGFC